VYDVIRPGLTDWQACVTSIERGGARKISRKLDLLIVRKATAVHPT
jgi:hypothetical protein